MRELSMSFGNRYSTALVSKRRIVESTACLRAWRCADRRRDLPHALDQSFDLFICRVTGAPGAQQSLLFFAEAFNHRLRIKITVRSEDAAFDQFLCDFD